MVDESPNEHLHKGTYTPPKSQIPPPPPAKEPYDDKRIADPDKIYTAAELALDAHETVSFTVDAVMDYLDSCITHWRKRNVAGEAKAVNYIDAFQSVRTSLFGELLDETKMVKNKDLLKEGASEKGQDESPRPDRPLEGSKEKEPVVGTEYRMEGPSRDDALKNIVALPNIAASIKALPSSPSDSEDLQVRFSNARRYASYARNRALRAAAHYLASFVPVAENITARRVYQACADHVREMIGDEFDLPEESFGVEAERLVDFILHNVDGSPAKDEGAVDMAIRVMTDLQEELGLLRDIITTTYESLELCTDNLGDIKWCQRP